MAADSKGKAKIRAWKPVAVDTALLLHYHRQFAVEVWPPTSERPVIPVPLPDSKQP